MAFRAIQPAPPRSGTGTSGSPPGPLPEGAQPTRPSSKPRNVVQACEDCRRAKTRCDGQSPRCANCIAKNRECHYVGRASQSRNAATKSRLESMEKLLSALRTSSSSEAELLLQRVRTADDLIDVIDSIEGSSAKPKQAERETQPDQRNGLFDKESHSLNPANQSLGLIRLLVPDASVMEQAVDSFFSCSGKLFHVFTREHISDCHRAVFGALEVPTESIKAKACSLMAVASVGAQYLPDTFSIEIQTGFYDLARHLFESLIEQRPLHAIKVCALLAQYNIMNKAMISLAYVEIGLGMSRLHGLGSKALKPQSMSMSEWAGLQKTWRTLVFFESWLSSTLGYITGKDLMSQKLMLTELANESPSDITEAVQTEMTKICLLKADILRMHLVFKDLTAPAMRSIMGDLQNWYRDLPDNMRLDHTDMGRIDADQGTTRSILHVHLLHLGAIMLLYRRIASQFLQWFTVGTEANILPMPLQSVVSEQGAETILAAITSARILKLLHETDGISRRCWLVIFQAYTTCTILLHAVIQKQLHNFEPLTWDEDKRRVEDCLSVLAFCGAVDQVAAKFHEQLANIFERIFMDKPSGCPEYAHMEIDVDGVLAQQDSTCHSQNHGILQPYSLDSGYLLDIPAHAPASKVKLSVTVLTMLSQPFGDSPGLDSVNNNMKQRWLGDPMRYEYPQLAGQLDWDFESRIPFQWDFSKLNVPLPDGTDAIGLLAGVPGFGSAVSSLHGFVGSAEPSGWASAEHVTKK